MDRRRDARTCYLRGFVTEADLPQAEMEWPGLMTFWRALPEDERPATFLELVWRFERSSGARIASEGDTGGAWAA
jgi:hypothetical protein